MDTSNFLQKKRLYASAGDAVVRPVSALLAVPDGTGLLVFIDTYHRAYFATCTVSFLSLSHPTLTMNLAGNDSRKGVREGTVYVPKPNRGLLFYIPCIITPT